MVKGKKYLKKLKKFNGNLISNLNVKFISDIPSLVEENI